jgi:hypothetical protein
MLPGTSRHGVGCIHDITLDTVKIARKVNLDEIPDEIIGQLTEAS